MIFILNKLYAFVNKINVKSIHTMFSLTAYRIPLCILLMISDTHFTLIQSIHFFAAAGAGAAAARSTNICSHSKFQAATIKN